MNIEILNKTLDVTENPGLDTLDPRFSDIATLVQNGDYLGAAARSEAILEENIYDIRIIAYFLYGIFIDEGVSAMADIFRSLSDLIENNWEAVGPVKKKEKQTRTSLSWLMKQLIKKLQYEEEKKRGSWNSWIAGVSSDQVQDTLDALEEFRMAVTQLLDDTAGPVLDGLMKIKEWLKAFQMVVYREPEPEAEEEAEVKEKGDAKVRRKSHVFASMNIEQKIGIEGSYHLKLLIKKIEAFEQLVTEEKFSRAALVADDINNIIANFDPMVYFPRLFSKYSLLYALNIGELVSFEEHKNTVGWQAMQELYKVDLNSFVSVDSEGINPDSSKTEEGDEEDEHDDGEGIEEPEYDEDYETE